jgi:hypothetical protein
VFRVLSSRSEQALRAVEMAKKVHRCEMSIVSQLKHVFELQAADAAAAAKKAQEEAAAAKKAQEEAAAAKKAQEEAAAAKKAQEEAAAAAKKKVRHC